MTNLERIARGKAAIDVGVGGEHDEPRTDAIDAIANILHAVDADRRDVSGILDLANLHFEAERS